MPKQAVDWTKQPLGLVPDADLAERLGVSVHTVRRQRQRRGILHLDMDIEQRIADALAQSDAPLTVKQLAEMLEKQDTWIQRKMLDMLKQGTVWRHRSGRGYVWTIAGKKLKRHALKGTVKATLKATPDEAAQLHGTACDDQWLTGALSHLWTMTQRTAAMRLGASVSARPSHCGTASSYSARCTP